MTPHDILTVVVSPGIRRRLEMLGFLNDTSRQELLTFLVEQGLAVLEKVGGATAWQPDKQTKLEEQLKEQHRRYSLLEKQNTLFRVSLVALGADPEAIITAGDG